MKMTYITAILLLTTSLGLHASEAGKALYEKNCTGCHGTEVFTRPDHHVKDMPGLKSRVKQCSYATESQWFDEDIKQVAEYLNKNFYKF